MITFARWLNSRSEGRKVLWKYSGWIMLHLAPPSCCCCCCCSSGMFAGLLGGPACTARPKTPRSCLDFLFSTNKIWIHESWGAAILLPYSNFSLQNHKKIKIYIFCLSFSWFLFIWQDTNGHFEVTPMSSDLWPPRYWPACNIVLRGFDAAGHVPQDESIS